MLDELDPGARYHDIDRFSVPVVGGTTAGDRWEAVAEDLDRTMSPYVDDDGVLLPMQTWVVTATRAT